MSESDAARPGRISVLMVCLGNICRSPMAEAVFRHHVAEAGLSDRIRVASAGTGDWHVGEPPHRGTLAELARHGLDLAGKRAENIGSVSRDEFDYVIAMDESNRRDLGGDVPLLLDFTGPGTDAREVPDPYYEDNFDEVYRLVDAGARGLLAHIVARHGLVPRPQGATGPGATERDAP